MRRPHSLMLTGVSLLTVFVFLYTFSTTSRNLPKGLARAKTSISHLEAKLYCVGPWRTCIDGANSDGSADFDSNHKTEKSPSFSSPTPPPPPTFFGHELDPAFSNVVNSVFPIDSVVSYNASNYSATTTVIARYASFSPILNDEIRGDYVFVAGSACSEIAAEKRALYKNKVLFVQRGKCTFEQKLTNIRSAKLQPRAVVVANNVPRSGLITMYSKAFSGDSMPHFPVIFMTYEDAEILRQLQNSGVILSIRTASFDGFIGLVLSMAVSPPLMILVCYLIIRGMQSYGRRRRNKINQQYVRSLPVHIYNKTHLVPSSKFHEYLVNTNQLHAVPSTSSSAENITAISGDPNQSTPDTDADLSAVPDIGLLFANTDYYATQKCAICLGRFAPLKSRVLVLGCKHIFHEKCLSNWLINFRKTCPLCNTELQLQKYPPLLENTPGSITPYGTFGPDLESDGNEQESHVSNVAVRSLQVDSVASGPETGSVTVTVAAVPVPVPVPSANNSSAELQAVTSIQRGPTQSIVSRDVPDLGPEPGLASYISNTGTSFFTTKSQQSTHASQISGSSSYHTSASVLSQENDNDDTEIQSATSSRSTLQF